MPAARLYLLPGRMPEEEKTSEKKASFLTRILREAAELGEKVQLEELWNLYYGEKSEVSIPEIAEMLFQENTIVPHLAVRRAMLADSIFFKRLKNTFEPRSPEVVAELKTKAQVEAAKKAYRETLTGALLKRIQGQDVPLPESIRIIEEYAALGMRRDLEDIIQGFGYEVVLCRRGPNNWELNRGSARILLSYHEESGMVVAESVLANLPRENILPIYQFLMQQNAKLRGLNLGISKNNIILSAIMFDQYIKPEFSTAILEDLITRADLYDDQLIKEFGALDYD